MNSNSLIGYQGLINSNYSTTIDADDIVCNSITAQHYYNIFCETLGVSVGNPEITLSFDPLNNTFTLHVYDDAIPLRRLNASIYDSLAFPSTLVFRDDTNSTTMSNLTISGLLIATANSGSVVSNSNFVNITNSTTNQFNPIVFITSSLVDGYKDLHYDNLNHLSINPWTNVLRLTNGDIQLNNGSLTINDALYTVNALTMNGNGIDIKTGSTYKINGINLNTDNIQEIPLTPINKYYTDTRSRLAISGTAPIIYNSSSGVISLNTTIAQVQTFTATVSFTNGSIAQGAPYSAVFGLASSKSGQIAIVDGTSNNQYAQLYCRGNNFGVQGNITSISLEKPTKIATSLVVSSSNLTVVYSLLDNTGVNIASGLSYQINSIPINTDNIQEMPLTAVNKYYTDARSRSAISVSSVGSEVLSSYVSSTGIITIPPITTNSVNVSKILKGLSGQFLQTSSTLINTWTTMSGDAILSGTGYLTLVNSAVVNIMLSAYGALGISSIVSTLIGFGPACYINATGSIAVGGAGYNDGVLNIQSLHAAHSSGRTYSTIIQNSSANTYIDNGLSIGSSTIGSSVNIGTVLTNQTVNLGSLGGTVKFNGGLFSNGFNNSSISFLKNSGYTTTFNPIGFNCSITPRSLNSVYKISVNIPVFIIGNGSNVAFSIGATCALNPIFSNNDFIGGSGYGILLQEYTTSTLGSCNFTYITTLTTTNITAGQLAPIVFNLCCRTGTTATSQPSIPYAVGTLIQMYVEEMF